MNTPFPLSDWVVTTYLLYLNERFTAISLMNHFLNENLQKGVSDTLTNPQEKDYTITYIWKQRL